MRQFWKFGSILAVLALLVVMGLSTQGSVQAQATSIEVTIDGSMTSTHLCSSGCTAAEDATFTVTMPAATVAGSTLVIWNMDLARVTDDIVTSNGLTPTTSVPCSAGDPCIDGSDANPKEIIVNSGDTLTFVAVRKSSSLSDGRDNRPGTDVNQANTDYQVKAFNGNRIRITLEQTAQLGVSKTLTVDNQDPTVVVNSPAAEAVLKRSGSVTFSATVTDGGASFAAKAADVHTASSGATADRGRIQLYLGTVRVLLSADNYSAVTGGWQVTKSLAAADISGLGSKVPWHIVVEDRAGNVKESAGTISGKSDSAGDATTLHSSDFGGAGYTNGAFNNRKIKISVPAHMADQVAGGVYEAPVNVDVSSTQQGIAFTVLASEKWSVAAASHSKAVDISSYASGTGTFVIDAADGLAGVAMSIKGTVPDDTIAPADADSDPDPFTFTKTLGAAEYIDIPSGASFDIPNTRIITVDGTAPSLGTPNAVTGHSWGGSPAKHLIGASAKKNSIQIIFIDQGGLDTSTVTPSVFTVAGNTVSSVQVIDTRGKSLAAGEVKEANSFLVFLTLGTDLGSSDRPSITIASGVIKDRAGNAYGGSTIRAVDRLGPDLTLSNDKDLSNGTVKITVTANEQMGAAPNLWVTKVTDDAGTATRLSMTTGNASVSPVTALSYSHTADVASLGSGEYNVYATGYDTQNNANVGAIGNPSAANTASSFTFELDNELNGGDNPVVSVSDKTASAAGSGITPPEVEAADPMIVTVDFKGESGEYKRDSHRTVTLTSASLKVSFADGTSETTDFDLTTDVSSPDKIKYTIPLLNPKVGNYTLTVKAMDSAGNNRKDGSGTAQSLVSNWEVVAPKPVNIELKPGWNLISLPFQPANPAINSVIPPDHPADTVMTFDNASQVWMVSRRDAETGNFTGDITVMTDRTAYFVKTENFEPLKLLRPALATAAAAPPPPPAVTVVEGWNLVPVVSNEIPTPPAIAADDYFGTLSSGGGTGWLKALTFDTLTRTWTSVTPGETSVAASALDNPCTKAVNDTPVAGQDCVITDAGGTDRLQASVIVGKGYWLYATADGVIIP